MTKILIAFIVALALLLICYFAFFDGGFFSGSRTIDFRGEVTDIYGEGGELVLTLDGGYGVQKITVDSRTKVKPCHKDDPAITMHDIKVGDTIEGDYRAFQNETAKNITVWYK